MVEGTSLQAQFSSLWMRDLYHSLAARAQFGIYGNIRDHHLMWRGEVPYPMNTVGCIWQVLESRNFGFMLVYEPGEGISVYPDTDPNRAAAAELMAASEPSGGAATKGQFPIHSVSLLGVQPYLEAVALAQGRRAAFVVSNASRLTQRSTEAERSDFLTACEQIMYRAAQVAVEGSDETLYNPLIWLLDGERHLPDWYVVGNDTFRALSIPTPDYGVRYTAARQWMGALPGYRTADADMREAAAMTLASHSEGMTLRSIDAILELARDSNISIDRVDDAVRSYRVGMTDNPWRKGFMWRRVREAEENIRERVKGQNKAITKTLDILKRSVLGLSGAQAGGEASKPRGVLFFAGPTGVGKTELARAISKEILGSEDAYIRFDMSEFSAEHAQDRLIGAPPGYVGFDAGGELTNAIRQRPLSVVLFDEIEKAHGRLLDKFLQILGDGRLTDGRGNTVYFSEAVIVFTSNLGTYEEVVEGDRTVRRPVFASGEPPEYEEVERSIRGAVDRHFKLILGRPELLNRIGDNVVVFDFIRPEVAAQIFDRLLGNVLRRVTREQGITLTLPIEVREHIKAICTRELHDGGRGIGNALESVFVNPLARALFEHLDPMDSSGPSDVVVKGVHRGPEGYVVDI